MKIVTVTDHALVRYLERVLNYDLDRVRETIRASVQQGAEAGARCVSVNGVTFHLDGCKVVTVQPGATPNGALQKTRQHHGQSVRMQRERREAR